MLTEAQLDALRPLEQALRKAVAEAEPEAAIEAATRIQALFPNDRTHHRLLPESMVSETLIFAVNQISRQQRVRPDLNTIYRASGSKLRVKICHSP